MRRVRRSLTPAMMREEEMRGTVMTLKIEQELDTNLPDETPIGPTKAAPPVQLAVPPRQRRQHAHRPGRRQVKVDRRSRTSKVRPCVDCGVHVPMRIAAVDGVVRCPPHKQRAEDLKIETDYLARIAKRKADA